tara:strand:- start:697 stop:1185 length:489 start_codon:yes stop_codon:yes gene_type:complete
MNKTKRKHKIKKKIKRTKKRFKKSQQQRKKEKSRKKTHTRKKKKKSKKKGGKWGDTCTICLQKINLISPKKISSCPCGHDFHHSCIKKWVISNNTCPVCREKCSFKSLKNKNRFPSFKCIKPKVQPEPREWGTVLGNYSRNMQNRIVPNNVVAVRDWNIPEN